MNASPNRFHKLRALCDRKLDSYDAIPDGEQKLLTGHRYSLKETATIARRPSPSHTIGLTLLAFCGVGGVYGVLGGSPTTGMYPVSLGDVVGVGEGVGRGAGAA